MINYDLFLLEENDHIDDSKIVVLNKIEVNHIGTVLRKQPNDKITLTDSKQYYYNCTINHLSKSLIDCSIDEKIAIEKPQLKITLFPSLLKGSQFDLQLEKSVELGCHGFQPLITDHVIANKNKVNKWVDAINKARKQCKQVGYVDIQEPKKLTQLKRKENQLWVVPEIGVIAVDLKDLSINGEMEICIFIGPEGGFSDREISYLGNQGASFINLGHLRLRAETAAWKSIVLVNEILRRD